MRDEKLYTYLYCSSLSSRSPRGTSNIQCFQKFEQPDVSLFVELLNLINVSVFLRALAEPRAQASLKRLQIQISIGISVPIKRKVVQGILLLNKKKRQEASREDTSPKT